MAFARLRAAVKRGVRVHIRCGGKNGSYRPDLTCSLALRLSSGRRGRVHQRRRLRAHGKRTVVDGAQAYLGVRATSCG